MAKCRAAGPLVRKLGEVIRECGLNTKSVLLVWYVDGI